MSDTTASLRHKISSAGDLQAVVRTMKSLAASSIVQYERSVHALGDYARTVELGLSICFLPPTTPERHRRGAVRCHRRRRGTRRTAAVSATVFNQS
jgi:F0F1-type ATP synthase gamma subunit